MGKVKWITRYEADDEKSSIVVSTDHFTDGWIIRVDLPTHVTSEDRIKMLKWLMGCREFARSANPLCDASFKAGENQYVLQVKLLKDRNSLKEALSARANSLLEGAVGMYGRS